MGLARITTQTYLHTLPDADARNLTALDKIRNSHAGQTDDGWTILGGRSVPHTGGIRSHKTVTTAEFGTPTELLGTGIQSPCAVW